MCRCSQQLDNNRHTNGWPSIYIYNGRLGIRRNDYRRKKYFHKFSLRRYNQINFRRIRRRHNMCPSHKEIWALAICKTRKAGLKYLYFIHSTNTCSDSHFEQMKKNTEAYQKNNSGRNKSGESNNKLRQKYSGYI